MSGGGTIEPGAPELTGSPEETEALEAGPTGEANGVREPEPSAPSGVFDLERRSAPGLYVVAWLFCGAGIALALVGLGAGPDVRLPLLLAGFLALVLGLASAAGYQVLARASLPVEAYRGPSPILAFGLAAVIGFFLDGLLIGQLGLFDSAVAAGLLVGLLGIFVGYLTTIVFFVVRTGALRWTEMGWPDGGALPARLRRLGGDAAFGVLVTLPALLPVLLLAELLASLLGVTPTERVPLVTSPLDAFFVVAAFAVVAPIGEELFFRGFVQSAWQRDLGPRSALIRAAIFFAVVHILNETGSTFAEAASGAILQFLVILPLGFILGWAFQRRGIGASIGGHMSYNGALLLLAAVVR